MYRDADEAAERRIEQLETRLTEQSEVIEELRTRLDKRDDYVEALSRKLDGRTRSPEKMWRTTAIALLVALAFTLIYAQTRVRAATHAEASPPGSIAEPAPTLADPVTAPQALAKDDTLDGATVDDCADNDLMCQMRRARAQRCDPDDPLCSDIWETAAEAKPRLVAKMEDGTATLHDLRALKALCMTDGDTACRNAAYAAWKAKKQDVRLPTH